MKPLLFAVAGVVSAAAYVLTRKSAPASSPAVPSPGTAPATAPEVLPDFIYIHGGETIVTGSTSGSRGIRNNNPGNIRKSADKWQGLATAQNDPAFFQFTEAKWGVRAMAKILLNYERKYGLKTARQLITRWAPGHENPTDTYVTFVASHAGVLADEVLDVADHLPALVTAIIRFENGKMPYTPDQIIEWVRLP